MEPWATALMSIGWLSALALAVAWVVCRRQRADPTRSLAVHPGLSQDGILLVGEGDCVTDANDQALTILGLTRAQSLSVPLSTVLPGIPGDALSGTTPGPVEVPLAGERALEVSVSAVAVGSEGRLLRVLTLRDITRRRRLAEDLRRFQFMVEHAATECYLVNLDGTFVYANRAAADSLGYTVDELLALGVPGIDPVIGPVFAQHADALGYGDTAPFETVHVAKDGRRIPKELKSVRLRIGDRDYVCGFGQPIAERKHAEEQRRTLEYHLRQTEKLERLAGLAGVVAHDFNNLLTSILGNLELALDEMPANALGRASVIESFKAGQRATNLTRQMLAFAGRGRLHPVPVQLRRLLEELRPRLMAILPEGVRLSICETGDVPEAMADAGQICEGLVTLVAGACESLRGRPGDVSVSLALQDFDEVSLAACRSGRPPRPGPYVVVSVGDTGESMDPDVLEQSLGPLPYPKPSVRAQGLATVFGVMRGLHGALFVDSVPGQGTTIRMLLPVCQDVAGEALSSAPPPPRAAQAVPGGARRVLLIIDDEPAVRQLASRMAARIGFGVLTATDGVEGVELFRARSSAIACVLLDLTMPRMGGVAAFAAMRRLQPDIPIVLCSGYSSEHEALASLLSQPRSCFLAKPFTCDGLRTALGQVTAAGPTPEPVPASLRAV